MFNIDIERGNYSPLWNCGLGDTIGEEFRITRLGVPQTFTNPNTQLNVKKADGTFVHQEIGITYLDGVFTIDFDNECVTAPGVTAAELLIVENGRTTTSRFFFYVRKTLDSGIIDSFSKVQQLEELERYLDTAYQQISETVGRIEFIETNNINLNKQLNENEAAREVAEVNRNKAETDRGTTFNTLKSGMEQATSNAVNINNDIALEEERRIAAERQRSLEHSNKMSEAGTAISEVNATDATATQNEINRGLTFNQLKGNMESATNAAIATEREIAAEEVKRKATYEQIKKDETARGQAEASRDTAEKDRVLVFNSQREAFDAINRENEANGLGPKVRLHDEQIAEIVQYTSGSNVDQNGITQPTLDQRLDADYAIVMDRFNKASLLPYEAQFINASNTYKGLTSGNVIKGRTLQSLLPNNIVYAVYPTGTYVDERTTRHIKTITAQNRSTGWFGFGKVHQMLKPSTKYTVIGKVSSNSNISVVSSRIATNASEVEFAPPVEIRNINSKEFLVKICLTTAPTLPTPTSNSLLSATVTIVDSEYVQGTTWVSWDDFMLLEGDIPNPPTYFEGIRSVNEDTENLVEVSCGKNLFNPNKFTSMYPSVANGITFTNDGIDIIANGTMIDNKIAPTSPFMNITSYLRNGKTYTSKTSNPVVIGAVTVVTYRDGTVNYNVPFTMNDNVKMVQVYFQIPTSSFGRIFTNERFNALVEEGSVRSTYEAYQEHRLPIRMKNLRGLQNGICDTSDGVRRIGKTPTTGWLMNNTQDGTGRRIKYFVPNLIRNINSPLICNKFPHIATYSSSNKGDYVVMDEEGMINIRCDSLKDVITDQASLNKWVIDNKLEVYYPLPIQTTEEGNTEQLRTCDGKTNIFTEGSLIEPTISCKIPSNVQALVATLNEENAMLRSNIDTLNGENEGLKAVNTTQDNAIDVTMLATMELYDMINPPIAKMSLNTGGDKMVDFYVVAVQRGLRTIEEVPARYREEVKAILAQLEA